MKFTAIFYLQFCLQVSARVNAQKVTLSEKGTSLQKIFRSIKKQTGLSFFFDESWLSQADKVSIYVQGCTGRESTGYLFLTSTAYLFFGGNDGSNKTKRNCSLKNKSTWKSIALAKQVTGKVTDENGTPLGGVSVVVKSSRTALQPMPVGEFTLEAKYR